MSPGSRLAGEREYAFKHVLIRDVAYSTLPKSVRARKHAEVGAFIADRSADRSEGAVAMVAEHYGRAAALGASADLEPEELERIDSRALDALESAGDASAALYSNQEALGHYETALSLERRARPRDRRTHRREARRRRAAPRARRPGDRCLGGRACSTTVARRIWPGSATCTERSAPACGTRATARDRSSTTSAASTCSRTARRAWSWCACTRRPPRCTCTPATTCSRSTPPRRRCGSPSDSTSRPPRAAPTASSVASSAASATRERARENLERSVELARDTDPGEAIRALLALGYHLEVSDADYDQAQRAYSEALELAQQTGRPALAGRALRGARPARRAARRLGGSRATDRGGGDARRAGGHAGQALLPLLDARGAAAPRGRSRCLRRGARAGLRARRAGGTLGGRLPVPVLARRHASRPRRPRRRRPGAGARARPLRARRAGRPVARGDGGPRRQPRPVGQGATRRARSPRRPSSLADRLRYPGRARGEPRGACARASALPRASCGSAACSAERRPRAWTEPVGRPARTPSAGQQSPRPGVRRSSLRQALGLVLAQEALEQALVALLVVEDVDRPCRWSPGRPPRSPRRCGCSARSRPARPRSRP